jgi:hypothetical protein
MSKHVNPVFQGLLKAMAPGVIREDDWIKSDYCQECSGEGFVKNLTHRTEEYAEYETDQCEECERLVEIERMADIAADEAKGD